MKRVYIGFAIMIFGLIIAMPGALFWIIGLVLSAIGLFLIASSK